MPENSADIGKQQIAAVYAKALLGAAENAHTTDAVVEELDSLVDDVLARFPHFEIYIETERTISIKTYYVNLRSVFRQTSLLGEAVTYFLTRHFSRVWECVSMG